MFRFIAKIYFLEEPNSKTHRWGHYFIGVLLILILNLLPTNIITLLLWFATKHLELKIQRIPEHKNKITNN